MRIRIVAWLVCILLCIGCAGASEEFSVEARGVALIDQASGRILYAQNADEMLPIASTTKVMTALLALENAKLSEAVTAGEHASGMPGTSMYLGLGETLSMEQMLLGLMLRSGNDAAVAIAEHVSGSVDKFAGEMNARAAEIGADAHFVNPHGLDADGHLASALGLARILREAVRNEDFRRIAGTRRAVVPWVGNAYNRVLENKNRLLATYDGAAAGKTGYTSRAGRCLAFSAGRNGLVLVGAVLNCPTWFDSATQLLDYGFENYRLQTALVPGETACRVAVGNGMAKTVGAVAGAELAAAVGRDERYSVSYDFGENLRAPIRRGDVIGTAKIVIGGETIAECELLAAESVEVRTVSNALRYVLERWLGLFQ